MSGPTIDAPAADGSPSAAGSQRLTSQEVLRRMPFTATVGIELDRLDPAEVTGRLDWAPSRCTVGGAMHGGALVTLADTVPGGCPYLNLPPGATTATHAPA